MSPELTMLALDRNTVSPSLYDLQGRLTPEGYLNFADPYSMINCMVIVKRVHGPATSLSTSKDMMNVSQKKMPSIKKQALEETKGSTDEDTQMTSETESEHDEEFDRVKLALERQI